RRWTVYHWSLLFCLPVLTVLFADSGTDYNHLLDLIVLLMPVVGSFCASLSRAEKTEGVLAALVPLALLWGLCSSWAVTLVPADYDAVPDVRQGIADRKYPSKPLSRLIGDHERILTEDPYIAVVRGQLPVVLDPWSLAKMTRSHAHLTDDLARRIGQAEFDRIILRHPISESDNAEGKGWEEFHFGATLVRVMQNHYHLQTTAEGYYVYVPREVDGLPLRQASR